MNDVNFTVIPIDKDELKKIIQESVKSALEEKKKKELLNFKEASEFLGVSTSTLAKWKAENKIPFKKLGKRIFFSREELIKSMGTSRYNKFGG